MFVPVPDRSMIRSNLLAVHRNPLYRKLFRAGGGVFHTSGTLSSPKIFSIRINGESSEIIGGSSTRERQGCDLRGWTSFEGD